MTTIFFEGKEYPSYAELCRVKNLSYKTFSTRREKGYTLKECIYGRKPIKYKGKSYRNERELCKKQGVNYSTFAKRKQNGYTLEECIKGREKKKPHGNKLGFEKVDDVFIGQDFVYNNVYYPSIRDYCKQHGLNYNTIIARVSRHNWTIEGAITGKKILKEDTKPHNI